MLTVCSLNGASLQIKLPKSALRQICILFGRALLVSKVSAGCSPGMTDDTGAGFSCGQNLIENLQCFDTLISRMRSTNGPTGFRLSARLAWPRRRRRLDADRTVDIEVESRENASLFRLLIPRKGQLFGLGDVGDSQTGTESGLDFKNGGCKFRAGFVAKFAIKLQGRCNCSHVIVRGRFREKCVHLILSKFRTLHPSFPRNCEVTQIHPPVELRSSAGMGCSASAVGGVSAESAEKNLQFARFSIQPVCPTSRGPLRPGVQPMPSDCDTHWQR